MRHYKSHYKSIFILTVATLLVTTTDSFAQQADIIVSGGKIYTMNPDQPTAEAVAIAGGKIVFVGSGADAKDFTGENTRRVNLNGGILIPGLIDAHGHIFNLGRFLTRLNLVGTNSVEEVKKLVANHETPGEWIRGRGWDQNDWEIKEFPTWHDLDGLTDKPVYLRRVDGHAIWVNKKALEICGITPETKDPDGGRIHRDSAGNPTGVLVDNATDLIAKHLPIATKAEALKWAETAIKRCNSLGLVGVHDAGVGKLELATYQELHKQNKLSLRIYAMLSAGNGKFTAEYLKRGPQIESGGWVTVRSVKMYADGALGSRGAALLEPYTDEPEHQGLMLTAPDSLLTLAQNATSAGFQICAHSIGDAGVRNSLDAYETTKRDWPNGDHRFRIEHSQVIALSDIPRYANTGVIASMQPTHATSDMYWAEERVGAERIKGSYAWRSLLSSGARLALGSDFPVESANPLWGIYAAVSRQDHKGWPEDGWRNEEVLTVTEAVRGFTLDAAYAEFAETKRGSIKVGKAADMTLLDMDIFLVSPLEILKAGVTHTFVDGKVVYQREG